MARGWRRHPPKRSEGGEMGLATPLKSPLSASVCLCLFMSIPAGDFCLSLSVKHWVYLFSEGFLSLSPTNYITNVVCLVLCILPLVHGGPMSAPTQTKGWTDEYIDMVRTNQSINQWIIQPINQSINQLLNKRMNEWIKGWNDNNLMNEWMNV